MSERNHFSTAVVHTSRAESLTKNLSRSAPRLTGRPRVEALVACGAHQTQTQGKCTREVGGRESGRGRESERACVPVPLSCGGRACTILLQEGGGAQSCSQRRHVNEYGPVYCSAHRLYDRRVAKIFDGLASNLCPESTWWAFVSRA